MREINLPITQTFSITIDREKIDMSKAVDIGNGRRSVCSPPFWTELSKVNYESERIG